MPRAALAVLIAALLVPATATAATRYAAPGGGMVPGCAQVAPCSLEYAITAASPGDEVVVTSGQYTVGATIETETPLWIHGQQGSPKPRVFAADKSVLKSFAPQRISDLSFESTNNPEGALFVPADGTVLERLEIFARGAESLGLRPGNNFTMTDTLILAETRPTRPGCSSRAPARVRSSCATTRSSPRAATRSAWRSSWSPKTPR
jgi:hypothetical protein